MIVRFAAKGMQLKGISSTTPQIRILLMRKCYDLSGGRDAGGGLTDIVQI